MRNEYRIKELRDCPGYYFIYIRRWWLPFWDVLEAVSVTHGKEDAARIEAEQRALTHATPKYLFSKYLGRLP